MEGGLSQEEVASAAGVSQAIVSQIELGRNQSPSSFVAIAKALKVPVSSILVETPEGEGSDNRLRKRSTTKRNGNGTRRSA